MLHVRLCMVMLCIGYAAWRYEHHLYLYGTTPNAPYSDMNGYGHFVAPVLWFNLYWELVAVGLVLLANLLWVRGTDDPMRLRLRRFRGRMARGHVAALATATIGFALVGAWIFYNTNILNDYRTSDENNRLKAFYEQRYKQYNGLRLLPVVLIQGPSRGDVLSDFGAGADDVTGNLPRSLGEGESPDRINVAASASLVPRPDSINAEFTSGAAELLTAEPRRAPEGCLARL